MSEQNKKYTTLGTMMVAKNGKTRYIKLEQQTKKDGTPYGSTVFPITLADGRVLKSGDALFLQSKKDKFQRNVEAGKMTQAKADELSSFMIADLVLVEDVGSSKPDGNDSDDINF